MGQWDDRIKKHAVWAVIDSLGAKIDEASSKWPTAGGPAIDSLDRLRTIQLFVKGRLQTIDPILIFPPVLDGIQTSFQSVVDELNAYIADANATHLDNANNRTEGALGQLPYLASIRSTGDLDAMGEAASAFRSKISQYTATLAGETAANKESTSNLAAKLAQLEIDIAAERQRLANVSTEQQGQFSSAQEARVRDF